MKLSTLFNSTRQASAKVAKGSSKAQAPILKAYSLAELMNDTTPTPEDIIAPRVLTPGGLLVFSGTPKIGKSYLMLSWLMHMAAGKPFLGMTPARPLKIVYIQADIDSYYMGERVQRLNFDPSLMPLVKDNLAIFTSIAELDAKGLDLAHRSIRSRFGSQEVDIIAIDSLYNVFERSRSRSHESDLTTFLENRIGKLRKAINPKAGVMLVHQSDKVKLEDLGCSASQSLHDGSVLSRFYSTCVIMHQPELDSDNYQLIFELRNGKPIATKNIELFDDKWREVGETDTAHKLISKLKGRKSA